MKKYKLKCFICRKSFNKKEDVFRNLDKYPVCENCLIEEIEETWDNENTDYIFNEIKKSFNRNYFKWNKEVFIESMIECNGNHEFYDHYFDHKDNMVEINGKNYCLSCVDKM